MTNTTRRAQNISALILILTFGSAFTALGFTAVESYNQPTFAYERTAQS